MKEQWDYESLNKALGTRDRRKVANNTYVERHEPGLLVLKLHGHSIADLHADGRLFVTDAGWRTTTTKDRLNRLLGLQVWQRDWAWFYSWEGGIEQDWRDGHLLLPS